MSGRRDVSGVGFGDLGDDALHRGSELREEYPDIFGEQDKLPYAYLHGHLALNLHVRARLAGERLEDLRAVFVRRRPQAELARPRQVGDEVEFTWLDGRDEGVEQAVFVPVVQFLEDGQRVQGRIRSVVRLSRFDGFQDLAPGSVDPVILDSAIPIRGFAANRISEPVLDRFKFFGGERVFGYGANQIVERGAKVVDALSNEQPESGTVGGPVDLQEPNVGSAFVVYLGAQSIGIASNPAFDLSIECLSMFESAVDLGFDAAKVKCHAR